MSAHSLSTVQKTLCGYLEAEAAKPAGLLSGLKVAREGRLGAESEVDATVRSAIAEGGIGSAMYVTRPIPVVEDQNPGKSNTIQCALVVFLVDNPTINITKEPLEMVEEIWRTVTKQSTRGPQFQIDSWAMSDVTEGMGAEIYAVNFRVLIQFQP